jgi:hypothetical protein
MASPFDAMLQANRRQFESLTDGYGAASPAALAPAKPPSDARPPAASDPRRVLNDRYGRGWRHEITERRRDGNEVVVVCKLLIGNGETAVTKTAPGRARIRPGAGIQLQGSADGVAFRVGAGTGPADRGRAQSEAAAFDAAERDALRGCVAMLRQAHE